MGQWVRWTMLALQSLLIGWTLVVAWRYAKQWTPGRGSLLPLHIWLIAVSYDLLLVVATVDNLFRYNAGVGITWRAAFVIPAVLLGLYSMWIIVKQAGRRGVH